MEDAISLPPPPPLSPRSLDPLHATAPEDKLDLDRLDAFIARWSSATGSERANYQLFLTDLCALLDLPLPTRRGRTPRTTPIASSG